MYLSRQHPPLHLDVVVTEKWPFQPLSTKFANLFQSNTIDFLKGQFDVKIGP